jgi:isoleucyl-tRNA synthetase
VLAADGQKMSKRKKNYPDPNVVIQKYGADALRMYLVNSPVVKAEPLKFREEGVLGVVKEVFLPLYNAFRFFLQNVERCESKSETKFVPDLDKARSTQNPTDIWIAAEAQGLIKFVHQEMQAYRLYTVMPSLVQFGTHLTNWYVRLNRERLKGNDGNDSEIALQVLYNVLMDVTVIMAPFTPFITEFFYQHLRKFEPSFAEAATCGSSNPPVAGKSDSVHFLKLPAYDATRLNPDALESMLVLQGIVEQGRNAREKRNISLKFPVKSIVVVLRNPSVSVIEAITGPLKKYILSELNAWDFQVVKKEEEQDWITVSLKLNFAVVGKRLGKRVKEIQNHVASLSHAEAVKCLEEGRLVIGVDDVVLDATTELEAKMEFSRSDQENWEATSKSDGSLVVAVDCTQDDETRAAGMAREVINGIQQLRKSAGLDISDLMEVFFEEEPGCTVVEEAIGRNVDLFRSKFKGSVPLPRKFAPKWSVKIEEDSLMIGETKVSLILCRPAIAARSGIDATVENALATLSSENVSDGRDLVIQIDGKDFTLTPGKDIWISTMDKVKSEQLISWIK